MNKSIQTLNFHSTSVAIIDHNNEAWMTGDDIGKALDYSNPRDSIQNLFERNRDEIEEYSVTIKLMATDGKQYNTRVYNEEGVMLISMFSNQPKAKDFRRWAVQVLKQQRQADQPANSLSDNTKKYWVTDEEWVAAMASTKDARLHLQAIRVSMEMTDGKRTAVADPSIHIQRDYDALQNKYIALLEEDNARLKVTVTLPVVKFGQHRGWTPAQDQEMLALNSQGLGWTAIGVKIGRSRENTRNRYNKLMTQPGGAL